MSLVNLDFLSFKIAADDVAEARRQGAFYLKISEEDEQILNAAIENAKLLFDWGGKDGIGFDCTKFVGYSCNSETTDRRIDQKEMFDWATQVPKIDAPSASWELLRGDSLWPSDTTLPSFRPSMQAFEEVTSRLSLQVLQFMDLSPLVDLYGEGGRTPHYRKKIVHYPKLPRGGLNQGCGAHTDGAEWLTFVHESGEVGLELEVNGAMVPVPSKPGYLLTILGQPLEDVTAGAVRAGQHRVVLSGKGDRYSAIFFMTCVPHLSIADIQKRTGMDPTESSGIPLGENVGKLIRGRRLGAAADLLASA